MKKIVVLYGNCHTGAVKRILQSCPEFNLEYEIYPMKEIQEVKDPAYFDMPIYKKCDVFIHQSIWEKNRYGKEYASENLIKKLNPKCKVIAMPNLYHMPLCLFPQYYSATELRKDNQTYFFRDKIIDEGLAKGDSLQTIAKSYYNYKFDHEILRNDFDKFIKKVELREIDWDIKVSSFIKENISRDMLFYEPNHPTNVLFRYYAEEILKILIDGNFTVDEKQTFELDTYQMPLLTEVKEALGLTYSTKDSQLRKTGTKVRNVPMDIKEYVNQYFSTIWICEDFSKSLTKKSKVLFVKYRVQNIFIKINRKIQKLAGRK